MISVLSNVLTVKKTVVLTGVYMYRIIFESVSAELSVFADSFEMETDTYDEIVRTIDYFRHIATLDVDRDDFVEEISKLMERERIGKSTREDERRFEHLDKRVEKARTYKYCRLTIYLLRGATKDRLWQLDGGMVSMPADLNQIARSLVLPASVLSTIQAVNPAWKDWLAERRKSAPANDVSSLALKARTAKPIEEKQDVSTQDIDITELPDLPVAPVQSRQPLTIVKEKKGKTKK
jgi:hypothetical protein